MEKPDDDEELDNELDNGVFPQHVKGPHRFQISISSYGHANGPLNPTQSSSIEQLTFSVRDMENPPVKLRKAHTGLSSRMRKEVFANQAARARLEAVAEAVEAKMLAMESRHSEARSNNELTSPLTKDSVLVVGIMCEQGKHRSVAFAEQLARKLQLGEDWVVSVEHRDLGLVALDGDEDGSNTGSSEMKISRQSKKQRDQERKKGRSATGKFFQGDNGTTLGEEDAP